MLVNCDVLDNVVLVKCKLCLKVLHTLALGSRWTAALKLLLCSSSLRRDVIYEHIRVDILYTSGDCSLNKCELELCKYNINTLTS